jgi:hypothetical protein
MDEREGHVMAGDEKEEYLEYYKKVKAKKGTPVPYGTWSKSKRQTETVNKNGGSRQYKSQMSGLSNDDYEAVSKLR